MAIPTHARRKRTSTGDRNDGHLNTGVFPQKAGDDRPRSYQSGDLLKICRLDKRQAEASRDGSRLASRSRSTWSRMAGKASDGVMTSSLQHPAERAAHDGLANGSGAFAAGAFGEFRRDLGSDARGDCA